MEPYWCIVFHPALVLTSFYRCEIMTTICNWEFTQAEWFLGDTPLLLQHPGVSRNIITLCFSPLWGKLLLQTSTACSTNYCLRSVSVKFDWPRTIIFTLFLLIFLLCCLSKFCSDMVSVSSVIVTIHGICYLHNTGNSNVEHVIPNFWKVWSNVYKHMMWLRGEDWWKEVINVAGK